jgi:hypothetical protein
VTGRDTKRILPRMDEEVARLGRSASARVSVPEEAEAETESARPINAE